MVERLIREGKIMYGGEARMTKSELFRLLVLIETVYSHCMTKDETVMLWFNFCAEMDYERVMAKLQDHIRKSPYPPTLENLAVFKVEKNKFPKTFEMWFQRERDRIEQNQKGGKRNPIPAWMFEYTTRKSVRG
jgi:hypothetical protein